jgi:hypothetical protein
LEEARISSEQKALFQRAADLQGAERRIAVQEDGRGRE